MYGEKLGKVVDSYRGRGVARLRFTVRGDWKKAGSGHSPSERALSDDGKAHKRLCMTRPVVQGMQGNCKGNKGNLWECGSCFVQVDEVGWGESS